MNDLTDQQLLHDYGARRSEAAFTELVRRHLDLVHSAALRMTGAAHAAQDVTQAVFVALAQNAPQLAGHPVLSGWLHTTARNLAAKQVRAAVRRQNHEQEAAAMNELLASPPDASWEEIAPHLDAALGALSAADRDAVLLRYFEKKSAAEIAARLGISTEAAQKRVSRAVDHLRELFAKRGVSAGAGGLAVVISANAVQAAPVGLAATISTAAFAGTATTSTVIATATKTIAMTTLQKTLVTATVAVLAGVGLYEAHQATQLSDQVQALQQQQALLAGQFRELQSELDSASNRVVALNEESAWATSNNAELLRLRGEVTRLRSDRNELAALKHAASTNTDAAMELVAKNWINAAQELHHKTEKLPNAKIPEFRYLTPNDWLDVAKDVSLESEEDVQNAASMLGANAKNQFARFTRDALKQYLVANNGELPTAMSQLTPFYSVPVDADVLDRYTFIQSGNVANLTEIDRNQRVISEKPYAPEGSGRPIVQIGTAGFIRTGQ